MSWDLALSPAGDLIFSPSLDVSGISGTDLVEQRMIIRLKVPRGGWTYDDDGAFGSQLYRLTGMARNTAAAQIDSYVREALRDMTEIEVDLVDYAIDPLTAAVTIIVHYHMLDEIASAGTEELTLVVGGSF